MTQKNDPIATFGEALLEVAEENPDVVALSADSSSGSGLKFIAQRFPNRHFEFGIMEQGVIGYAAGLATTGKIPFVAAIAPFVTARPFEMVRNDLGYMRQNVKLVGRSAGITYSDLGATHQSLDDIAIVRTIPGFTVVNPGDPEDIAQATHAIAQHRGPVYMKIGKYPMPYLHGADYRFELGKAALLRQGSDVTLIGTGTVLCRAVEAAELLARKGIEARVLDMHTIKPLDTEAVLAAASETGRIVTVEEHYIAGGLGGAVAEFMAENLPTPMKRIGINDCFASNGPYEDLIGLYGLLGPQIAESVEGFLQSSASALSR